MNFLISYKRIGINTYIYIYICMSDLTCIYLKCWPIIKISKNFNVKKKITYSVCAYKYERWRRGILFEKNISFPLYIIFFLEISIFLSSLENWKIINKSSWSSICTSRTIAVIYDRFILNTSQFLSKIHWDRFFFLFFFYEAWKMWLESSGASLL